MWNRRDRDFDERQRGEFSGAPDHQTTFGGDWARDTHRLGLGDQYARDTGWSGGGRSDDYARDLPARADYRGVGPKNWSADEAIRHRVCSRLAEHPAIDASGIEVRVEGREVTIEGAVHDRRTKRLAEELAASCRGVDDVHNRLRITAPAVHIGKASE
jgi:hypothetical protein